jgi:hypothetical protein
MQLFDALLGVDFVVVGVVLTTGPVILSLSTHVASGVFVEARAAPSRA